jgi:hypothetical protein
MRADETLSWNHVGSSRTCVAPVAARFRSERAEAVVPRRPCECSPPEKDRPFIKVVSPRRYRPDGSAGAAVGTVVAMEITSSNDQPLHALLARDIALIEL